jgi:hypothetical protein
MPFDDAMQETDALSQLSSMPSESPEALAGPAQGGADSGGPGVDTPSEQQAVQLFLQGMQLFRQGAQKDPTTQYIIDKCLQDTFLQIAQHYGYGEDAKLALKQAQMIKMRERSGALSGAGPMQGPPVQGGPAQGPPPMGSPQRDMMIEY